MPNPPTDASDERLAELGAAIRELVDAFISHVPDAATSDAALASVQECTSQLRMGAPRPPTEYPDTGSAVRHSWLYNPVIGRANPLAPPATFVQDDNGTVTLSATLGRSAEGPPGRAHGGWVAMLLDQTLGHANGAAGYRAFTKELTVSYLKGTPLNVPLEITARTNTVNGRNLSTSGELIADGVVTATASGSFVQWADVRA